MLIKNDILDLKPVQHSDYFSLDGELFIGDLEHAIWAFNAAKTDKKFRIWLIDSNFKILDTKNEN